MAMYSINITWSLIFWDYLITLDDEITFFWSSRRSWIKFLFFANRYMGLLLRVWDIIWEILEVMFATPDFYGPSSSEPIVQKEDFLIHLSCYFIADISGSVEAYEACFVWINSGSVLYVSMQLLVIESILILRIWVMTGKRRWALWTYFGLLICSTTASIVLSVCLPAAGNSMLIGDDINFVMTFTTTWVYGAPTLIFEAIIFGSAAYHGIKASGGLRPLLLRSMGGPFWNGPKPIIRLVFQGSVLYFITVLLSLPIMVFLDPRLGITTMSIAVSYMLLGLRKNVLSDPVGPSSQGVELTTLRFTANRALSSEEGEATMNTGSFP
ncbi:hypothetical protein IW261DRAFT_1517415 [Armillaria novae-zelandiae]|uniref:DUF6533 domain-containing protein n=1 Tax=Armillaria novae-zelandiae TaxID=153914 RepID=A0AA39TWV5_9AGAR|nr:hypothetical protein IW261DRAFT_1517415 [Armillaria novae-zelandiae]